MIRKILIANRGEIACRIIRTCRRLGIASVAVYSDADASALHVRMADESVHVGESESASSYLNQDRIVAACKKSGVQAVHPGYGFLSENASFVERLEREGILFIGPPAKVVKLMGDKLQAKKLAEEAGVPVIPGLSLKAKAAPAEWLAELERFTGEAGFPIMIKAAGGGGGRGMRKVYSVETLERDLLSAQREAQAFFSDGRLFAEKLVENARHIEVQIFGDRHSNVVHLFDRDCSMQRNHQKMIEEAPAYGIDPKVREEILGAAVRLARRASYQGAGTVEFLLAGDGRFYFLEVNSRLQVEHPVTEMITGLDLVELQIRLAEGADVRGELKLAGFRGENGAAIECRICAESPEDGFAPATGKIVGLELSEPEPWPVAPHSARLDTGFARGDSIGHHYDSLLAKLIVHAETRREAIEAAIHRLATLRCGGVRTNISYLISLLSTPEMQSLRHHVNFAETRIPAESELQPRFELAGALYLASGLSGPCIDDAWQKNDGWRLFGSSRIERRLRVNGRELGCALIVRSAGSFELPVSGRSLRIEEWRPSGFRYRVGTESAEAAWLSEPGKLWLSTAFGLFEVSEVLERLKSGAGAADCSEAIVSSSLPGKVVDLRTAAGKRVEQGEVLLVIESMKMEHQIKSPRAGHVKVVNVEKGKVIEANASLIELEIEAT